MLGTDIHRAHHRKGADGFVDVYRQTATGLDRSYVEHLSSLIELALRVGALADTGDSVPEVNVPSAITHHPRPLLDIFAECARRGIPVRRRVHHHDWPVVRDPGSGYARLHRWLSARLDGSCPIDIDAATLDVLGAPPADLHWPMDALVHPLGGMDGMLAYLTQVVPAGRLDARFLPALDSLGEQARQESAYQRFLDAPAMHWCSVSHSGGSTPPSCGIAMRRSPAK